MSRRQPLIWLFLRFFIGRSRSLSHERALVFGERTGLVISFFLRRKSREAAERCSEVLGVSEARAQGIVRAMFRCFGRSLAEFARLPVMAKRLDECVCAHGEENLREAVARGKGVIMITAHIGNWEYAGSWLAQNGYAVSAMGTDQRDGRITELVYELRRSGGMKSLAKQSGLKGMVRALAAGGVIAIPIDQDAKKAGILSPFLGKPASTPVGVMKLAARYGCAVIPAFCIRRADGVTLDFHILPEMKGRGGRAFGKDLQDSVDDCNRVISDWIRRYPDQWIWIYPRWESYERGLFDEVRN
jgi:lauroyl/myristoyl acyltransferase